MLMVAAWRPQGAIDAFFSVEDYIQKQFKFSLDDTQARIKASEEPGYMCPVCYIECEPEEIVVMPDCGHAFCDTCFGGYLESKVQSGNECVQASCMETTCGNIVSEATFKKLLSHESLLKYRKYLRDSFIDLNRHIKWCPGQNCSMVCESKLGESVSVQCICGTSFCFGCDKMAHKPMDCQTLEKWDKKVKDGAGESGDGWIRLNTKPCPKCKVPIEKN